MLYESTHVSTYSTIVRATLGPSWASVSGRYRRTHDEGRSRLFRWVPQFRIAAGAPARVAELSWREHGHRAREGREHRGGRARTVPRLADAAHRWRGRRTLCRRTHRLRTQVSSVPHG